jgi:hypothetical protein
MQIANGDTLQPKAVTPLGEGQVFRAAVHFFQARGGGPPLAKIVPIIPNRF